MHLQAVRWEVNGVDRSPGITGETGSCRREKNWTCFHYINDINNWYPSLSASFLKAVYTVYSWNQGGLALFLLHTHLNNNFLVMIFGRSNVGGLFLLSLDEKKKIKRVLPKREKSIRWKRTSRNEWYKSFSFKCKHRWESRGFSKIKQSHRGRKPLEPAWGTLPSTPCCQRAGVQPVGALTLVASPSVYTATALVSCDAIGQANNLGGLILLPRW